MNRVVALARNHAGLLDRAIVLSPVLAAVGLMAFAPSDDNPTICPFALCTGTACPGCGLTRAAGSLIRGDLNVALAYHPLVPLILVELLGSWIWFLLYRLRIASAPRTRTVTLMLTVNLLALVVVWAIRLATGTLPHV